MANSANLIWGPLQDHTDRSQLLRARQIWSRTWAAVRPHAPPTAWLAPKGGLWQPSLPDAALRPRAAATEASEKQVSARGERTWMPLCCARCSSCYPGATGYSTRATTSSEQACQSPRALAQLCPDRVSKGGGEGGVPAERLATAAFRAPRASMGKVPGPPLSHGRGAGLALSGKLFHHVFHVFPPALPRWSALALQIDRSPYHTAMAAGTAY